MSQWKQDDFWLELLISEASRTPLYISLIGVIREAYVRAACVSKCCMIPLLVAIISLILAQFTCL